MTSSKTFKIFCHRMIEILNTIKMNIPSICIKVGGYWSSSLFAIITMFLNTNTCGQNWSIILCKDTVVSSVDSPLDWVPVDHKHLEIHRRDHYRHHRYWDFHIPRYHLSVHFNTTPWCNHFNWLRLKSLLKITVTLNERECSIQSKRRRHAPWCSVNLA